MKTINNTLSNLNKKPSNKIIYDTNSPISFLIMIHYNKFN